MAQKFLIPICFLITVLFSSCLREDDIKLPFESLTPMELNDGWEISAEEPALKAVFEDFHADKDLWQPRSLIVVKDGCLIAETYTKDAADRTAPQAVWSCTKQILAIIVMKAIEEGYIESLEVTIGDIMPEMAAKYPDKADISLRHLMTMTSGIAFENSGLNGDTNKLLRRQPENSLEYILGLPMAALPGKRFNYSDGDPQVVSAMLAKAFGCGVDEWSRRHIFQVLEIQDYDWLAYPDGLTMGAFGLKLTPRNLAKFGQLILDKGVWHGKRILSEASVSALTDAVVPSDKVNYEHQEFGLLWWINPDDGTPYMHGQGGQYVMINRQKRIVVCITSEPNTQGDAQLSLFKAFRIYRDIINSL